MTTPLIINRLYSGCIFLQRLIDMCASDTGLEPESQNDDDTDQSTEVDNSISLLFDDMIDVVYEDETDDEANFYSKWSCS